MALCIDMVAAGRVRVAVLVTCGAAVFCAAGAGVSPAGASQVRVSAAGVRSAPTLLPRSASLSVPAAGVRRVTVFASVSAAALASGVGQYPGTAAPGQVGNFAVAGHRVSHGGPFRKLNKVKVGSRVVVRAGGRTYTYRVRLKTVVRASASSPLAPVPFSAGVPAFDRFVTLTTCTPPGSTKFRLVVVGRLTSVR